MEGSTMEPFKNGGFLPKYSTEEMDLYHYLDGTDPELVGPAAKRLDYRAFLANQISREHYEKTLEMTNEQIMAERDNHY